MNIDVKLKKYNYIKYIFVLFFVSIFAQTLIFVNTESGFFPFVVFAVFLMFILSLLSIYIYKYWLGYYTDPFILYSIFFLINYYYSTLYLSLRPRNTSNVIFNYSLDGSIYPLMICFFGYVSFFMGYVIQRKIFKNSFDKNSENLFSRKKINIFLSYWLFSLGVLFVIIKSYGLSTGSMGSLVNFYDEKANSNYILTFFRPFVPLIYIIIGYFCVAYFRYKKFKNLFLLLLFADIILSLVAGDRRILLIYTVVILIASFTFGSSFFRKKKNIFTLLFGVAILFILGTFVNDHMNSGISGGEINYFSNIFDTFKSKNNFGSNFLLKTFDNVFGTFGQLFLVDTAFRLNSSGFSYDFSPFFAYIQGLVPFKSMFGIESITPSDLQFPLFVSSLHIPGKNPYLTLPQFAESFASGGFLSLFFYSFFYGSLMFILFRISFVNEICLVWYISFFPFLSFGFLSSLVQGVIFPIKSLVMILFFNIVYKLIFYKKNQRIKVYSQHRN